MLKPEHSEHPRYHTPYTKITRMGLRQDKEECSEAGNLSSTNLLIAGRSDSLRDFN